MIIYTETSMQNYTHSAQITSYNFCRTTLFKRSVVNMGIELYSKLPNKIKNMGGLLTFKKELKSFLLIHSFYTVNEFISSNKKTCVNTML
jgi:hypothetical protein